MREASFVDAISAAFRTLTTRRNRTISVIGPAPMNGEYIEITLSEAPLQKAMLIYSRNILLLSLVIIHVRLRPDPLAVNGQLDPNAQRVRPLRQVQISAGVIRRSNRG